MSKPNIQESIAPFIEQMTADAKIADDCERAIAVMRCAITMAVAAKVENTHMYNGVHELESRRTGALIRVAETCDAIRQCALASLLGEVRDGPPTVQEPRFILAGTRNVIASGNANIVFGYTPALSAPMDAPVPAPVPADAPVPTGTVTAGADTVTAGAEVEQSSLVHSCALPPQQSDNN